MDVTDLQVRGLSVEEGLNILFGELELAIRWQRPSILLAVCPADVIRRQAQEALIERLRKLKQRVHRFEVNRERFDLLLILSQEAGREKTVFFVYGLRWGGGKGGGNAYRALNLRRELLVDYRLRVVFWLTPQEAAELPRRAPDFWAFRHRVVEFPPVPIPLSREAYQPVSEGLSEAISWRESMLMSLPQQPEAQPARLNLLGELVSLYRQKGDLQQSLTLSQEGLTLAERLNDPCWQARFWDERGLSLRHLGEVVAAQEAFREAIALDRQEGSYWEHLAETYGSLGELDEAIQAVQQASVLQPQNARAWALSGRLFYLQGRLKEARRALQKATQLSPNTAEYWAYFGGILYEMGRVSAALAPLRKAIHLDSDLALGWSWLGRALLSLGKNQKARLALEQALQLNPQDEAARDSLEMLVGHPDVDG